jgi:oligopeptide/dipeptide ABC transporter ATP-binding protein
MYLGRIVELGCTEEIMQSPQHPYTRALISAIPRAGQPKQARMVLSGDVPSPAAPPAGCPFHPRCPHAAERCSQERPPLEPLSSDSESGRIVACLRKDDI